MTVPLPPPVDAMPLPAPPGLMLALSWLASFAWSVPAGLAIGWPMMTVVSEVIGRGGSNTSMRRLAAWLAKRTAGAVALATVMGVAPLVIDSVLHARSLVPAAQHMGWLILAAVVLLLVGCGAAYWVALRRRGAEPSALRSFMPDAVERYMLAFWRRGLEKRGVVMEATATASLLGVGFVLVALDVAAANPGLWGPSAGLPSGLLLPLKDPQLLPRLLHGLLGAISVSALIVAWHGSDRAAGDEAGYGRTALRAGVGWFTAATALQAVTGPWLLFSLPASTQKLALGSVPWITAAAWGGAGLGAVALVLMLVGGASREPRPLVISAAGAAFLQLAVQSAAAQALRWEMLGGAAALAGRTVSFQPVLAWIFAGTVAVGGAVMVAVLLAGRLTREE
jgi:hypothetical protein